MVFCAQVTASMMNQLITKVKEDLGQLDAGEDLEQVTSHMKHINVLKNKKYSSEKK